MAKGGEGDALESRSEEFQRKIVLLETQDGTGKKETRGLVSEGERKRGKQSLVLT